jgi:YidC/Oxa1 family membrane protein insertase
MELWTQWTQLLETCLSLLVTQFGLSQALAIILLTLLARSLMMPVSLSAAYKMHLNKQRLERVQPELEALRRRYKDKPQVMAEKTLALYRKYDIRFMDRLSLMSAGAQTVFGIGVFQVLNRISLSSKFLWISNLAKPDLLLTVITGLLMLLGMALMPGATADASMLMMLAVSVVISVIAVAALPSALGIYWATSNAVTIIQSLALRGLIARHSRVKA